MTLKNDGAQFGGPIPKFKPLGANASTILSREMSTVKLQISPPTVTTISIQPTTPTPPSDIEKEVLESIRDDDRLSQIYNQVLEAEYKYFIIVAINLALHVHAHT